MGITNEIKQSAFSDEWQKALINILYTGNWLTDNFIQASKQYGINDQHYNILRILRGQDGKSLCPGEIKDVLLNKRGDLTRLLDKLVKMGLVERKYNETNRRKIDINIKEEGLNLLTKMDVSINKIEDFKSLISNEEAKSLNSILDKLRG